MSIPEDERNLQYKVLVSMCALMTRSWRAINLADLRYIV